MYQQLCTILSDTAALLQSPLVTPHQELNKQFFCRCILTIQHTFSGRKQHQRFAERIWSGSLVQGVTISNETKSSWSPPDFEKNEFHKDRIAQRTMQDDTSSKFERLCYQYNKTGSELHCKKPKHYLSLLYTKLKVLEVLQLRFLKSSGFSTNCRAYVCSSFYFNGKPWRRFPKKK